MTLRTLFALSLLAAPLLAAGPARAEEAAEASAVGRWRTIDDKTKKPKSIVVITEEGGRLVGRVEQLLDPPEDDPAPTCKKCKGDRKDQPIVGMTILWGMKKDSSGWSGGKILDPKNGKTYKCNLMLEDGGKKLQVRGFVGIALVGRTQNWIREE